MKRTKITNPHKASIKTEHGNEMKSRNKVTKILNPTDRSLESHNKIPQHPKSKSHEIALAFSFGPVSRSRSFGRGHEIGEAKARAVALHRLSGACGKFNGHPIFNGKFISELLLFTQKMWIYNGLSGLMYGDFC